jgi:hypothetical protein
MLKRFKLRFIAQRAVDKPRNDEQACFHDKTAKKIIDKAHSD